MLKGVFLFFAIAVLAFQAIAQPVWSSGLDANIRFYQTTDFGILLAGTDKSLYAIDGETGQRLWRRSTGKINETAVTPVPDTDLILFTRDLGSRSRLEAVDIISGAKIWESDKVKGDVMQLAIDPANDLLAVVMAKDNRGNVSSGLKRKPVIHVLKLSDGDELWKRDLSSSIEMMPASFNETGETLFTLDNYRAPMIIDGRLFLFYEGATSYDARTGKEREKETFKINEDGLALTEADPVFDNKFVYITGRGRIRAVDRRTGNVTWKADDLGITSEMAVVGDILYVRTGGTFTRLKDGETVSKGPFGVSAIDTKNGKTLWRYKGADKGLTNFTFRDERTILIADKDDLTTIDARTGKRIDKFEHKIDNARFVLINENRMAVVGGQDEIAAFASGKNAVWRVRHKAPARGLFKVIAGIALRATALYFRYGGVATTALNFARTGLNVASTINSFRWSGLRSRFGSFDLTTLASNAVKNYATKQIYSYGSFASSSGLVSQIGNFRVVTPDQIRSKLIRSAAGRIIPSREDVQESLMDRLDPANYADKLAGYLLKRKRVAELRGNYMYFYTDLAKPFDRKGLVGVNIHNGFDARIIINSDPDAFFITDEAANLLYSGDGNDLKAFEILNQK